MLVYYETRKRELKRRLINEGRCDERLKAKVEESTCLTYTGLNDKNQKIINFFFLWRGGFVEYKGEEGRKHTESNERE
jgi:hypothetical protein